MKSLSINPNLPRKEELMDWFADLLKIVNDANEKAHQFFEKARQARTSEEQMDALQVSTQWTEAANRVFTQHLNSTGESHDHDQEK